jgi:hypothetical protein
LVTYQNYTKMRGQKNIKKTVRNISLPDNGANGTRYCVAMPNSTVLYCWQLNVAQQYKENSLVIFHDNNAYAKSPMFYVSHTLPVLLKLSLTNGRRSMLADWCSDTDWLWLLLCYWQALTGALLLTDTDWCSATDWLWLVLCYWQALTGALLLTGTSWCSSTDRHWLVWCQFEEYTWAT